MKSANRFRQWVLFPVATAFIVAGFFYFRKGEFFGGITSFLITFAMGVVGKSLDKPGVPPEKPVGGDLNLEPEDGVYGLTEAESQVLTRGVMHCTLVLTVATVVLMAYSSGVKWWVVGSAGLVTTMFFPPVALFTVVRLPQIFGATKGGNTSLLPSAIDCPSCSVNMFLDEQERLVKYFTCPKCSTLIDLRN